MAEVRLARIYGQEYLAAPEGLQLWIVYKQYQTGKIERVAAYFTEKCARAHAAELVGKDQALVGLETIPVKDAPPS